MSETVTYPLDKDAAGSSYWKVMMSYAASYPEQPTEEDKTKFKAWFLSTLKSFPCQSCRQHAKEYILSHPPQTEGKQGLFDWMCQFENHIRQQQGKEALECKLQKEEDCPSCSVDVDKKDVKSSFKDLKDVSRRVFEELCKREKIPVPEIKFAPCPSAPFTSCTQMEKDLISGDIKQKKSIVYLNPDAYSPRTIYHEFIHYAMYHKGKDDVASDEWEVERIAQKMMKEEFPYDSAPKSTEKPFLVFNDTSPFITPTTTPTTLKRNYLEEATDRLETEFPMYAKYKHEQEQKQVQEQQVSETSGVLSIFDSIYSPFEEAFGLKARALNEMHTSNILAATGTTLIQSNLSPFGSLVASLLTGLGLLGAGALGKKNISIGDRRFLSTMGAYFLWNNIGYSNPKISQEVTNDAKLAIDAAKTMNWDGIKNLFIESPEKKALATSQSQSQAQQQAAVSARRGQRSAGRGAGGRRGQGLRGGRRPSISSKPDILRRIEQRRMGLPEAPDVGEFKQFPTRGLSRRTGEFSPESVEIGEGTPTSNTFPFYTGEQDFEPDYDNYDEYSDLV